MSKHLISNYLEKLKNKESFREIYNEIYNKKIIEATKPPEVYKPINFLRTCLLSYALHF